MILSSSSPPPPHVESQVVSSEERPTVHLYDQDVRSIIFHLHEWIIILSCCALFLPPPPPFLPPPPPLLQMIGHLNYDVWKWIVGYTVDDMRFKRSFPNFPDVRLILHNGLIPKLVFSLGITLSHWLHCGLIPKGSRNETMLLQGIWSCSQVV